jgi:soluble lytic murein transglycosylase-like protein
MAINDTRTILLLIPIVFALLFTPIIKAFAVEPPHDCLAYTSMHWGVPSALLLAVHEVEGGKPGTIAWNRNKTYDMGPMQFNSATVADLEKYGVKKDHMLYSECASLYVAGWKLATSAHKFQDWRLAIAAYNCGDGAVARAIKKRGSVNVSELDIPASTKNVYIPKVLAAWGRYAR